MLWVERGIRPQDLLDPELPPEITDELEHYLEDLSAAAEARSGGSSLAGPMSRRLSDAEMIALVKANEAAQS
jgi:hypothetical protein